MKRIITIIFMLVSLQDLLYAQTQKVEIPIGRIGFHDNIDKEQAAALKFDGKADDLVRVSDDQTINLQVTDALIKQIDDMQTQIELDSALDHRLKIKYLSGLYVMIHDY